MYGYIGGGLLKYYKVINNSKFIGVGTSNDFCRLQKKHGILLACDESQAQYIQISDNLYHAQWMLPDKSNNIESYAEVIEISESEYNNLHSVIESGEEIQIEEAYPQEKEEETPIIDENTEITVEFVKTRKINEMSMVCSNMITNGFDVVLSDGKSHHFSLTTQDQLNLMSLNAMIASGESNIPYHADGELCKFYSPEDIISISTEATNYKTYHVSYFNSLKAYIESMNNIEDISAITYGTLIPEEYVSDVLKVLLKQIGQIGSESNE